MCAHSLANCYPENDKTAGGWWCIAQPSKVRVTKQGQAWRRLIMVTRKKLALPEREPCSASRSRNMAAIKSRGNKSTEGRVLTIMKEHRCTGWRRHLAIYGTPDFAFPSIKLAIFVNGCFWHGCPKCFRLPKTNVEYWTQKIARNVSRDRKISRQLRRDGWSVMHIWEHSLRGSPSSVGKRILLSIQKRRLRFPTRMGACVDRQR